MPPRSVRRLGRLAIAIVSLAILLTTGAGVVGAADGLTMEAGPFLAGHVRPGSWMAIEVHLRNDGPPVTGELRLAGGSAGRTSYGVAVDMPTGSDKRYVLYAQPPNFGATLDVALVAGGAVIGKATVGYELHQVNQTLIGVIADDPGRIIAGLDLPALQNAPAPAAFGLAPESLPDRVQGWTPLDRIIWQDVDSTRLSQAQIGALRSWVASGGRLVIVGGTAGPGTLSAIPDDLLPYRPEATVDVDPEVLLGLVGRLPAGTPALPALAGALAGGRAIATSADRVVAAERTVGAGNVTVVGIDPTLPMIAGAEAGSHLWQRVLPTRETGEVAPSDDNQILSAVSNVPTLALPPVSGLLALLVGYIILIGPVNYLVLRRIDRREWAWVTMPALIAVFAVGAFAYGAVLRGSDILLNEVAIVRGAPGTSEGIAQAYVGLFSPGRGTYQVHVAGDALLSAPINTNFFGDPNGTATALDILQGDPSSVRDLAVAIGGYRVVRADSAVVAPALEIDLQLRDGSLSGSVRNASDSLVEGAAVILGSTVVRIGDLGPGETGRVRSTRVDATSCCQAISDRLLGAQDFGSGGSSPEAQRTLIRRYLVEQLTFDPNFGRSGWMLGSDGPVVVGWSSEPLLPVEIEGHEARRTANILHYVPSHLEVGGATRFRGDLLRSTIVDSDAPFFSKDPWASIGFGRGTLTMSFQPIAFEGELTPRRLVIGPNFGPDIPDNVNAGIIEPIGPAPEEKDGECGRRRLDPDCPDVVVPLPDPVGPIPDPLGPAPDPLAPPVNFDGLPEIELYDVTSETWMAFEHLPAGLYEVADGPRYVDPETGQVLVRFRNEVVENVGFTFTIDIEADVT
jgi:hypothetical protein